MSDIISRELAIELLENTIAMTKKEERRKNYCVELIKAMPSAEPHWIPCGERMPEEHEWIGTKDFGTTISDEVYVTFGDLKGGRFCKHLSFQNGKISRYDQMKIDAFHKGAIPIAWKPLPKPYEGEAE